MKIIKTRELIESSLGELPLAGRISLQQQGEKLDRVTNGQWVVDELAKVVRTHEKGVAYIIDSVRIPEQVNTIRLAFPPVTHVHLTANDDELRRRYNERARRENDPVPYDVAKENITEKSVGGLKRLLT